MDFFQCVVALVFLFVVQDIAKAGLGVMSDAIKEIGGFVRDAKGAIAGIHEELMRFNDREEDWDFFDDDGGDDDDGEAVPVLEEGEVSKGRVIELRRSTG